ncbi:LuxR family transcriptional regulator, partial [Streptomyces atratus]
MERQLGRYAEADALLRRELDRRPGPSPSQRIAVVIEWCCRALGDGLGEIGALTLAAMSEAYEGDTAEARDVACTAARLTDALTDSDLAGVCEPLVRLGWAEVMLDAYADAERHTERCAGIA